MEISILTVNRNPKPNYLDTTLASLQESDWRHSHVPVNFIMGSDDISHVPAAFAASLLPWDAPTSNLHDNFTRNYIRALRFRLKADLVIFEDDIAFGKNWLARLFFAIQEIKLSKYVLSLYTAIDLGAKQFDRGVWYRSYFAQRFFGTQGVFYPARVREEVAEYMERNIGRKPGDLLISEWSDKNDCLYLTQGSVIQHIGRCTTGLGGFHQAWNLQS